MQTRSTSVNEEHTQTCNISTNVSLMCEVSSEPDGRAHLKITSSQKSEDEGGKGEAEATTNGGHIENSPWPEHTEILKRMPEKWADTLSLLGVKSAVISGRHQPSR